MPLPCAKADITLGEFRRTRGLFPIKNKGKTLFHLLKLGAGRVVDFFGRYVPVRHRYVFTRKGGLRLRYVAAPGAFCLMLALTGLAGPASGLVGRGTDFYTAARDFASAETRLAFASQRLSRYNSETGAAESGAGLELASFVPDASVAPEIKEETLEVGKGDTLAGVLQKAGVGASEAYKVVTAMADFYDPRKIRAGQEIAVRFDPVDDNGSDYRFSRMTMDIDPIRSVSLTRKDDDAFEAEVIEKEVVNRTYAARADIEVSLYGSAHKAGIPASVIADTIHIYSWDIDFQRDVRKGDMLEVMYEQAETKDGIRVKGGDILYARLNINGDDVAVYRYKRSNGDTDYFNEKGESIRKALMQTPIDGARLSSGFGMRKHPVLGYNKMHKGVDFAAPHGTPIYAAGDGTIEKAGPFSSYGNYVRIRHNSSLKTAYAHLKGFAKGVTPGARVKQGQVIGYVGTTGRSTGPHLHYEVLKNNRQVNPKEVNMPEGERLAGADLAEFKKQVAALNRQFGLLTGAKLAMRDTGDGRAYR